LFLSLVRLFIGMTLLQIGVVFAIRLLKTRQQLIQRSHEGLYVDARIELRNEVRHRAPQNAEPPIRFVWKDEQETERVNRISFGI
jgi:hypothetical protein